MTKHNIDQAVAILRRGSLVAFPTETVYGLGADASNAFAVEKVFQAKGRPHDHPLIVHLANMGQLSEWAAEIPIVAEKLAQAFWPGPLTLILKKQAHVLDLVTAGQSTVGLRIPAHPIAHALLTAFGGGVVAPSANPFTYISPTTAEAVIADLGDKVEMVLDGGVCTVGVESTIVDVSGDTPVILRPGMITQEQIAAVAGGSVKMRQASHVIRTPGMHPMHYAPKTKALLLTAEQIKEFVQTHAKEAMAVMLYSHADLPVRENLQIIPMPTAVHDYAHALYQTLRFLDQQALGYIIIEATPITAEWEAIRDRLNKATNRV